MNKFFHIILISLFSFIFISCSSSSDSGSSSTTSTTDNTTIATTAATTTSVAFGKAQFGNVKFQ